MTRTFPVSPGLLEHKDRMGIAIWEYLWLLEHVTSDEPEGDGQFSGVVNYGNPVSANTVGRDLRESTETAKENLRRLSSEGYIVRKLVVGSGYSYWVVKSKRWCWKRENGRAGVNEPAELFPHRAENPSMENLPDERAISGPMNGPKVARGRAKSGPNNKEKKTRRQTKKTLKTFDADASEPSNPPSETEEKTDPRHHPIRSLILQCHLEKFRANCEWTGREGKVLNQLLGDNPSWTETKLATMVRNRFQSDGITSSRPAEWIPKLGSYLAGPHNQFNRVKGTQFNGSKAEQRQADNLAALNAAFPVAG